MCEEKTRQVSESQPSDDKSSIKHEKIELWDYYEEISPNFWNVPGKKLPKQLNALQHNWHYVWRMLKDISNFQSTWTVFPIYAGIGLILSFFPAITFWYSGQLLKIVSNEN